MEKESIEIRIKVVSSYKKEKRSPDEGYVLFYVCLSLGHLLILFDSHFYYYFYSLLKVCFKQTFTMNFYLL